MKFLVDAQLPPALAQVLIEAGHQVEHVEAVGLREAGDGAIWRYIISVGAALITKDEDFAALSRSRPDGPAVVWLRIGNTSNRALRDRLSPMLAEIVRLIEAGERLIEIR